MNFHIRIISIIAISATIITSCTKNRNYSNIDHTVGMTGARSWTGPIYGYYKGDTLLSSTDTTHTPWPKVFSRTIADTLFAVQKLDGYRVSVWGVQLPYRATDSTAQTVRYDTTLPNSSPTILTFYYAKDSMTFEYHMLGEFNSAAGNYYQTHAFMHTK